MVPLKPKVLGLWGLLGAVPGLTPEEEPRAEPPILVLYYCYYRLVYRFYVWDGV